MHMTTCSFDFLHHPSHTSRHAHGPANGLHECKCLGLCLYVHDLRKHDIWCGKQANVAAAADGFAAAWQATILFFSGGQLTISLFGRGTPGDQVELKAPAHA